MLGKINFKRTYSFEFIYFEENFINKIQHRTLA